MRRVRSKDYGPDVLATPPAWRTPVVPEVPAERDEVVEHAETGFCGSVVAVDKHGVTLEDRHGRRRVFPLEPAGFLLDGAPVTLVRPRPDAPARPATTPSGSIAAPAAPARVAVASRLFVEGAHDAELLERLWGDDLRYVGVVVELLDGADHLPDVVAAFRPGPTARMGVLLDHLVTGSKESRITAAVASPHVLVLGHPYVDVWQAVKPHVVGLAAWPEVPRGLPWKETVAAGLGFATPRDAWRHILGRVSRYTDLEPALLGPVERLIDFVTEPHTG